MSCSIQLQWSKGRHSWRALLANNEEVVVQVLWSRVARQVCYRLLFPYSEPLIFTSLQGAVERAQQEQYSCLEFYDGERIELLRVLEKIENTPQVQSA